MQYTMTQLTPTKMVFGSTVIGVGEGWSHRQEKYTECPWRACTWKPRGWSDITRYRDKNILFRQVPAAAPLVRASDVKSEAPKGISGKWDIGQGELIRIFEVVASA